MPKLLSDIIAEWSMIKAAPRSFVLAVGAVAVAIWLVIAWSYNAVLNSKNAQIEMQDRQIVGLHDAVAGHAPSQKVVTDVTSTPYRVQITDDVLEVFISPSEIILPIGFPRGKSVTIKDMTGKAVSAPITITAEGGQVDGLLPQVQIQSNRAAFSFIWNGKEWSLF